MSYTGRKPFLSLRERKIKIRRRNKYIFVFAVAVLLGLAYKNRIDIIDYLGTFFY